MKKITLLLELLLILTACNSNTNLTAVNLMEDINENNISPIAIDNLKKDDANKTVEIAESNERNIFINRVIHKTKIEVDEKGTKAGAVTAVEMVTESAAPSEPKVVNLNRPFFFMIVDNEFSMPIFMGVLNEVK